MTTTRFLSRPVFRPRRLLLVSGMLVIGLLASACGGGGDATEQSDAGKEGGDTFEKLGCGACHGDEDGVGPSLVGVFGSEETLEGGETVKVDAAYLERSILEPQADLVAGFTTKMPLTNVSDTELASILVYLEELK